MMDRLSSFDGRFAAQTAQGYGKPDLIAQSNQRLAALREQARTQQTTPQQPKTPDFKAAFNATLSLAVQELTQNAGPGQASPMMDIAPQAVAPAAYRQPNPTRVDLVVPQPQSQSVNEIRQAPPTARITQAVSPQRPAQSPERVVRDVMTLAQQSGFVGVNQDDVLRAYHTGQSFLADYKV